MGRLTYIWPFGLWGDVIIESTLRDSRMCFLNINNWMNEWMNELILTLWMWWWDDCGRGEVVMVISYGSLKTLSKIIKYMCIYIQQWIGVYWRLSSKDELRLFISFCPAHTDRLFSVKTATLTNLLHIILFSLHQMTAGCRWKTLFKTSKVEKYICSINFLKHLGK